MVLRRMRMKRGEIKTSFYLPRALLRAAKARAAADSVSLRTVLVRAVEAYVASTEKGGKTP